MCGDKGVEFIRKVMQENNFLNWDVSSKEALHNSFQKMIHAGMTEVAYSTETLQQFSGKKGEIEAQAAGDFYKESEKLMVEQLKDYLKSFLQDRSSKSVDEVKEALRNQEEIKDNLYLSMTHNMFTKDEDLFWCIQGEKGRECVGNFLKKFNIDINSSNVTKEIEKLPVERVLNVVYKAGADEYSQNCVEAMTAMVKMCEYADSPALKETSLGDVHEIFSRWKDQSENSDSDNQWLNVQKNIFMCSFKDREFDPEIYDLLHGKNNIQEDYIHAGDLGGAASSKVLQSVAKDYLDNKKGGILEHNDNLSEEDFKKYRKTVLPISAEKKDFAEGGIGASPDINVSEKRSPVEDSIDVQKSDRSIFSGLDSATQQSNPNNYYSNEINNLGQMADKKINHIENNIDEKEQRIKELEERLKNESKSVQNGGVEGKTDSSQQELLDLIKSLKGEVSSLKADLNKVKQEKDTLKNVARKKVVATPTPAALRKQKQAYRPELFSPKKTFAPRETSTTDKIERSRTSMPTGRVTPQIGSSTSAESRSSSFTGGQQGGEGVGRSGSLLSFSKKVYEPSILTESRQSELYTLLKSEGKVKVTTEDGKLQIVTPIFNEKGEIVGTEIVDAPEEDLKAESTALETQQKAKMPDNVEEMDDKGLRAYFEKLKAIFQVK